MNLFSFPLIYLMTNQPIQDIYQTTFQSIQSSINLSNYLLSIFLFLYLSTLAIIFQSIQSSIQYSNNLSISSYPSTLFSICQSIQLSIYLSILRPDSMLDPEVARSRKASRKASRVQPDNQTVSVEEIGIIYLCQNRTDQRTSI